MPPIHEGSRRALPTRRACHGEPGALIIGWKIDRPTYRAFPVLADGQLGPELNLRELFKQYHEETH
jgi:hypothetical protein